MTSSSNPVPTAQVVIVNTQGEKIKNYPFPPPNAKQLDNGEELTYSKKFDFASLWGSPGTIVQGKYARIDIQKPAKDYQNIQIQLNGTSAKSTFAAVLVELRLANVGHAEQLDVIEHVRQALRSSIGDKSVWWTNLG